MLRKDKTHIIQEMTELNNFGQDDIKYLGKILIFPYIISISKNGTKLVTKTISNKNSVKHNI